MKSLANIALLVIFSISMISCSDEESLYPTCPASGQQLSCVISSDGNIVVQGAGQEIPDNFKEQGECRLGVSSCVEVTNSKNKIIRYDVVCEGYVPPSHEICDRKDNDCDGKSDEDFDRDGDG